MRFFKLNTPILALLLSLVAEGLFMAAFQIWRDQGGVGPPSNLFNWLFYWFHLFPKECLRHIPGQSMEWHFGGFIGYSLLLLIAVFQWWLIFFTAIWLVRHFTKKPV
jgi:hypothetical protein